MRTAAFDRANQRRLLAANVAAAPDDKIDIENKVASQHALPPKSGRARLRDRVAQNLSGARIFISQINPALARTDRVGRQEHSLEQRVRIVFEKKTIDVSARIAFVGVGDDKFFTRRLLRHRAPFTPGGKPSAAASAQSGGFDRFDDFLAWFRESFFQDGVATLRGVSLQAARLTIR